jgi:hypothetical protein
MVLAPDFFPLAFPRLPFLVFIVSLGRPSPKWHQVRVHAPYGFSILHIGLHLTPAGRVRLGFISAAMAMEITVTTEIVHKLVLLSRQLTENLMSAALCAKELSAIANAEADHDNDGMAAINGKGRCNQQNHNDARPLLDESTLSVTWQGRSVRLGHTQAFWLLARLSRRANQYVTHLDLMREIWDDEFADTSLLRAGVQRLRLKLRHGGMADLARAITGHHGRFMLDLEKVSRHTGVTAASHRTSQA